MYGPAILKFMVKFCEFNRSFHGEIVYKKSKWWIWE